MQEDLRGCSNTQIVAEALSCENQKHAKEITGLKKDMCYCKIKQFTTKCQTVFEVEISSISYSDSDEQAT